MISGASKISNSVPAGCKSSGFLLRGRCLFLFQHCHWDKLSLSSRYNTLPALQKGLGVVSSAVSHWWLKITAVTLAAKCHAFCQDQIKLKKCGTECVSADLPRQLRRLVCRCGECWPSILWSQTINNLLKLETYLNDRNTVQVPSINSHVLKDVEHVQLLVFTMVFFL